MAESAIQVGVRVRPFNARERKYGGECIIGMQGNCTTVTRVNKGRINKTEKPREFVFDYAFWTHGREDGGPLDPDSQEEPTQSPSLQGNAGGSAPVKNNSFADQPVVYKKLGSRIVEAAVEGYNSCLFAYGQTGSGKTYTMVGAPGDPGVLPRLGEHLFAEVARLRNDDGLHVAVECSVCEIYNDVVQDLVIPAADKKLHGRPPPKEGLPVRQHPKLGVFVQGLRKTPITTPVEFTTLIDNAFASRAVTATNMNATSSRSHAVVMVTVVQTDTRTGMQKTGKMSLVDLAGSERAEATGATGSTMVEAQNINYSLTVLGMCLGRLADNAEGRSKLHVPFRDSSLSYLLSDNLGGNSKTSMLAAISPAAVNYEETVSTLRFASVTKKVKTVAVVNESANAKLIRELKQELAGLRDKLMAMGGGPPAPVAGPAVASPEADTSAVPAPVKTPKNPLAAAATALAAAMKGGHAEIKVCAVSEECATDETVEDTLNLVQSPTPDAGGPGVPPLTSRKPVRRVTRAQNADPVVLSTPEADSQAASRPEASSREMTLAERLDAEEAALAEFEEREAALEAAAPVPGAPLPPGESESSVLGTSAVGPPRLMGLRLNLGSLRLGASAAAAPVHQQSSAGPAAGSVTASSCALGASASAAAGEGPGAAANGAAGDGARSATPYSSQDDDDVDEFARPVRAEVDRPGFSAPGPSTSSGQSAGVELGDEAVVDGGVDWSAPQLVNLSSSASGATTFVIVEGVNEFDFAVALAEAPADGVEADDLDGVPVAAGLGHTTPGRGADDASCRCAVYHDELSRETLIEGPEVYHNGLRVDERALLRHNDRVIVGRHVFRFVLPGGADGADFDTTPRDAEHCVLVEKYRRAALMHDRAQDALAILKAHLQPLLTRTVPEDGFVDSGAGDIAKTAAAVSAGMMLTPRGSHPIVGALLDELAISNGAAFRLETELAARYPRRAAPDDLAVGVESYAAAVDEKKQCVEEKAAYVDRLRDELRVAAAQAEAEAEAEDKAAAERAAAAELAAQAAEEERRAQEAAARRRREREMDATCVERLVQTELHWHKTVRAQRTFRLQPADPRDREQWEGLAGQPPFLSDSHLGIERCEKDTPVCDGGPVPRLVPPSPGEIPDGTIATLPDDEAAGLRWEPRCVCFSPRFIYIFRRFDGRERLVSSVYLPGAATSLGRPRRSAAAAVAGGDGPVVLTIIPAVPRVPGSGVTSGLQCALRLRMTSGAAAVAWQRWIDRHAAAPPPPTVAKRAVLEAFVQGATARDGQDTTVEFSQSGLQAPRATSMPTSQTSSFAGLIPADVLAARRPSSGGGALSPGAVGGGAGGEVSPKAFGERFEIVKQWVDDSTTTACGQCTKPFTLFRRRHHCRGCGGIFCSKCLESRDVKRCARCRATTIHDTPDDAPAGDDATAAARRAVLVAADAPVTRRTEMALVSASAPGAERLRMRTTLRLRGAASFETEAGARDHAAAAANADAAEADAEQSMLDPAVAVIVTVDLYRPRVESLCPADVAGAQRVGGRRVLVSLVPRTNGLPGGRRGSVPPIRDGTPSTGAAARGTETTGGTASGGAPTALAAPRWRLFTAVSLEDREVLFEALLVLAGRRCFIPAPFASDWLQHASMRAGHLALVNDADFIVAAPPVASSHQQPQATVSLPPPLGADEASRLTPAGMTAEQLLKGATALIRASPLSAPPVRVWVGSAEARLRLQQGSAPGLVAVVGNSRQDDGGWDGRTLRAAGFTTAAKVPIPGPAGRCLFVMASGAVRPQIDRLRTGTYVPDAAAGGVRGTAFVALQIRDGHLLFAASDCPAAADDGFVDVDVTGTDTDMARKVAAGGGRRLEGVGTAVPPPLSAVPDALSQYDAVFAVGHLMLDAFTAAGASSIQYRCRGSTAGPATAESPVAASIDPGDGFIPERTSTFHVEGTVLLPANALANVTPVAAGPLQRTMMLEKVRVTAVRRPVALGGSLLVPGEVPVELCHLAASDPAESCVVDGRPAVRVAGARVAPLLARRRLLITVCGVGTALTPLSILQGAPGASTTVRAVLRSGGEPVAEVILTLQLPRVA